MSDNVKATDQTFFDQSGRVIPVSWPEFEGDDDQPDPTVASEAIARLLVWITERNDPADAGRRALLLAHLAGITSFKTDASLARKLNISKSRLSQLRRDLTGTFGTFARCNGRRKLNSGA